MVDIFKFPAVFKDNFFSRFGFKITAFSRFPVGVAALYYLKNIYSTQGCHGTGIPGISRDFETKPGKNFVLENSREFENINQNPNF